MSEHILAESLESDALHALESDCSKVTFDIEDSSARDHTTFTEHATMIKNNIWLQFSLLEKHIGAKNFRLLKLSLFLAAFFAILLLFHIFNLVVGDSSLFGAGLFHAQSTPGTLHSENKPPISLENIFDDTFQLHYQSFKFIRPPPDAMVRKVLDPGLFYTVNVDVQSQLANIEASTLFNPDDSVHLGTSIFTYSGQNYQVNSLEIAYDLQSAIIGTNRTTKYRHTKQALYWFRDTATLEHTPVGNGGFLRNCKYSQAYNFVYYTDANYDFYIQPIDKILNVLGSPIRVTSDGLKNSVLNGVCDWVYQEEVFGTDNSVWFAPDDSRAIYMKQFEDNVEVFEFPKYILPDDTETAAVQEMDYLKYPRPGGILPKYELQVVDLSNGEVHSVVQSGQNNEILYAVDWINSNAFLTRSSDRSSKTLMFNLHRFNSSTAEWTASRIRSIPFKDIFNGYAEKQKPVTVLKQYRLEGDPSSSEFSMVYKHTGFAYLAPDDRGFQHIHFTQDINKPDSFIPLTHGAFEVNEIVGFDRERNNLYFMSNAAHPMSKHLSMVNLDSRKIEHLQLCESSEKNDCVFDYNEVELSMTTRWAYRRYMGPEEPELYAGATSKVISGIIDLDEIHQRDSEEKNAVSEDTVVLKLGDTEGLLASSKNFGVPTVNFKNITLHDGVVIHYKEYLPPGYETSNSEKKYSLLTHVYGAPGSTTFTSKYSVFFESLVASKLESIVLEIEPRGTGGKGWKFKQWATGKIGYWEPRDVQEVVKKYIAEHENRIIKENVAIWGWSYGGFVTLKTLEYDRGETFKYGLSVAPVTDWKLYDAVYSERYLGSPSGDQSGYENAVISDIEAFKNSTRFLIITGTGDDNVHALNTYRLLDQFNLHEVSNFDMQVFPDSDHKIAFHNGSRMVYRKLYSWLGNAFSGVFDAMAH